jgi:hypothetical protein
MANSSRIKSLVRYVYQSDEILLHPYYKSEALHLGVKSLGTRVSAHFGRQNSGEVAQLMKYATETAK